MKDQAANLPEVQRCLAESDLATLQEIVLAVFKTANSVEAQAFLTDHLPAPIGAEYCVIVHPASPSLAGANETRPRAAAEDALQSAVAGQGRPLIIESVCATPYLTLAQAAALPVETLIGLPVVAGGRTLGALLIGFASPHAFTDEEVSYCVGAASVVAVTLEMLGRLDETTRQARTFEMLSEISAVVRLAQNPDEISRRLVEQIGQRFGARAAGLTTPATLFCGYGEWASLEGQSLLPESAPEISALGSARPYFDLDLVHGPLSTSPHWTAGLTSLVGAPIVVDQRLNNVLWLGTAAPLSSEQKHQLVAVAEMAANALQRAAAFERERQLRAVAEALADTATAVSQTGDLETVLAHILDRIADVVACAGGVVLLKEADTVLVPGRRGPPASDTELQLLGVSQPMLIADTGADPHWPRPSWVRAIIAAPIWVDTETVGVLALYGAQPQAFDLQMLKHLQAFAAYAAIAVRNARQQADLQHQRVVQREDRQRIRQSEKLATLGELVAGVAHELNNPLTTILLFTSQLLQEGAQAPTLLADLQKIAAEAQRSAKLVHGLLEFARQRSPEQKPVHVDHVLLAALDILAYELRLHNIQVVTVIAPDLPLTMADPYQLQQVFTNLINNAWQAMSQAYASGILTIRAEKAAGSQSGQAILRIAIGDTGPGISPSALPDIFTPFYTTKAPGKGTGLGLSVAYGIIAQHQGQIWVETSLPHGAVFTVELPIIVPVAVVPEAVSVPGLRQPLGAARILLVDDEVNLAEVVARVLRNGGSQVTVAHTGVEGLALIRAERYDLLISDIRMPEMSGPEFYRHVVTSAPELAERMIFITGDTVSVETRRFLATSGVAYLSKPFEMTELLQRLAQILSGRSSNPVALPNRGQSSR